MELISREDAARRMGCTVGHVDDLVDRGVLTAICFRSERRVLIDPALANPVIDRRPTASTATDDPGA